jgi:hypothetical protein
MDRVYESEFMRAFQTTCCILLLLSDRLGIIDLAISTDTHLYDFTLYEILPDRLFPGLRPLKIHIYINETALKCLGYANRRSLFLVQRNDGHRRCPVDF